MSKLLAFAGDAAGYLTPREAAEHIPLKPRTIRDKCASGEIKALKLGTPGAGRRYKIHRDSLAAFLRRH